MHTEEYFLQTAKVILTDMNLQKLFFLHAVITLAAGIVLMVVPAFIPATVNINITPNEYLLCYFLAAAEFAVAYLSFSSRKIKDKYSLRIISISFIVFHTTTGLLEAYALMQGVSSKIVGNIVLRIIVVILFYYYGVFKTKRIDA